MRHFFTCCLLFLTAAATAQVIYYVKFPDDLIISNCNAQPTLTPPQFFNPNGLNLSADYTDEIITVVPDACYRIDRTWTIKGPNYDPLLPCVSVPNPHPNAASSNHPANLRGPVVSPSSNPNVIAAPWTATRVAVNPGAAQVDYAVFYNGGTYTLNGQTITVPNIANINCFTYKQIIKIIDTGNPVVSNCPAATVVFQDSTFNNPQLWNEPYWLDPVANSNDLRETPVPLSVTASESCPGSIVTAKYQLFLDLDQDGTTETVVQSASLPPAGTVLFNSANTVNFSGGTPQDFDGRGLATDLKYRFGLYSTPTGQPNGERSFHVGWNTAQNPSDWTTPQLPCGNHSIKWVIGDGCGNETVCDYAFTIGCNTGTSGPRVLRGKVRTDLNADCQADPAEPALPNWKVRLDHLRPDGSVLSTEYSAIGPDSLYQFLVDTGRYRLTPLPPNAYYASCGDTLLTINSLPDTTNVNLPAVPAVGCAFLETDIGTPLLRRCFHNTYTVRYCNTGTAAAEGAFVRVKLDPFLNFVSASLPGIFEGNQVWRFDVGKIPVNDCGQFTLVAYLNCASTVIGQTHCMEAHIYPDSTCLTTPNWSGANVEVSGTCLPDSVRFVLRNTGKSITSLLQYRLIRDGIIVRLSQFQLPAGGTKRVSVPANGSTWRLEADQEPGNPYTLTASATVEACGKNPAGGISTGFVSQFDESDGSPAVSVDCQESRGSYDPNDKQGFPLGYGPDHLIEPGQPLEYLIRFQNTGTDTAFTVVVADTLSEHLDPASVQPGASSHPYRFEMSDSSALRFVFEHIFLPDSNVNEAASHGFVKFRVKQRGAVPLGTTIGNQAAIYFDFNAPVITNETQHQVGKNFVPLDAAAQNDYYIRFPDDLYVTNCTPQAFAAEPQLFNTHGANITVGYIDEIFPVIVDACYQITRTWTIKSADYDPALPCTQIPNPNPHATLNNPANLLGPVVSPSGTPAPWTPTEVKLQPSAPMPTNFSTYWSATANCYQYAQKIKVLDTTDPAITCPSGPIFFADSTVNDSLLWNAPYWFDPSINSPNWSEAPVNLSIQTSDDCYGTNLQVRALLFLDLDGNGSMETVVDSRNPPAAGQVNFGNAQNPNFTGGTPRDFDQRPVAAAQKYRFGIQKTVNNNQLEATLGWNTEQDPNTWTQLQLPPGQHKIKWAVEDGCGNERVCETIFQTGKAPTTALRTLQGRVFWDTNEDCQFGPNDFTPNDWQRIVLYTFDDDGKTIATTDVPLGPGGTYQFLVKTGRYGLAPSIPNGQLFAKPCPIPSLWVQTVGDTSVHDFAIRPSTYCPVLQTDIGTAQLRPCEDNDYTVRYCNTGTVTATDAFVRVRLDRFLTLSSSSLPAVDEGNRYWRIPIGNIAPLECGSLRLTAHLDCDSILPGQTFCTEAHIYPDTACVKLSSGGVPIYLFAGTMDLDGACAADSVRFTLRNVHPIEAAKWKYALIQDDQVWLASQFSLAPGQTLRLSAPADGSTWRLQIDLLKIILPVPSNLATTRSVTVEACGRNSAGGISTGFVSQYAEDDRVATQSVDCQQTTDHYLPIDKQGYPLGYSTEHLIERGQPLDYIIRFQNLGTDTVRRVVVTDTLDKWLSGGTAQPGVSSHPYTFQRLSGNAIQFVFDNIQLPSWSVNEPASHGFVKFRARQLSLSEPPLGAQVGAIILNRASVKLDGEPPILTPTTRHKVGQGFVKTSSSEEPTGSVPTLRVWPNPAPNGAVLHLANLPLLGGRFDLYDARGRFVLSRPVQSEQVELGQTVLPSGMYFFKIFEGKKMCGAGKLGVK